MVKIENTIVEGWSAAIRGLRNPMNSWDRSDSYKTVIEDPETLETAAYEFFLGEDDLELCKALAAAGSDHRKFLRMVNVTCDVTAPLYWWKQFDTYKVGTVTNSCSTMHTLHKNPITLSDFSDESLFDEDGFATYLTAFRNYLGIINVAREAYIRTHDKKYWDVMITMLPESFNQRRTVQVNYEVLRNIYHSRKNHKLVEWHAFCEWIENLPYAKELIINDD